MPIGINQINNPTPAWVTTTFNIIFYVAAAANIIIAVFTDIPEHVQLLVLKYSGQIVLAAKLFAHLFGVEVKEPTVPTEEVAALKNP